MTKDFLGNDLSIDDYVVTTFIGSSYNGKTLGSFRVVSLHDKYVQLYCGKRQVYFNRKSNAVVKVNENV